LPFSPFVSGYALAGLGGAQWSRNYPDFNSTDVGFSFGLGAEFNLPNSPASLTAEWVRLVSGNNAGFDYTANQLTFGVN
jgi:hypothetical protein